MAAEGLKHYLKEPPPVTVDPSKHVSLSAAHMLLKKQKHNKTKQKTKQNQTKNKTKPKPTGHPGSN